MNKTSLLLILFTLVAISSYCQPYGGQGFHSKGFNINLGYIFRDVDVQFAVDAAFFSTTVPTDLSINGGKKFWLSQNYSVTPYIGMTQHRAAYSFEIGRDGDNGKLYLLGKYTERFYFGIGVKAYIN